MTETPSPENRSNQAVDPSLFQDVKETLQDQSVRNKFMQSFNGAAGYFVAGAALGMETPGVLPKVVGGALAAKGMYEQVAAVRGETSPESASNRLRERIFMFADSLVDKNSGKMNLVSRLRRRTGEEILNFRDQEASTRFNRMMGGMAVLMSGIEFANQPGTVNKIIGVTLGSIGLAEQAFNTQKLSDHMLHKAE